MPQHEAPNLWEQLRIPATKVRTNDHVYDDGVWRAALSIEQLNGVLMMFNGRDALRVPMTEHCTVMRPYKPAEPDPDEDEDTLSAAFRLINDLNTSLRHKSSDPALHDVVRVLRRLAIAIDERTEK